MRSLEEQQKRVTFWESWTKAVSSTELSKKLPSNPIHEVSVDALKQEARRELVRAAHVVNMLYLPKTALEFSKYKHKYRLTLKEFQAYRSKLPWYRRAFLLYRAPNPAAARMKFVIHLSLSFSILEIIVLQSRIPAVQRIMNTPPPTWFSVLTVTHVVTALLIVLVFFIITTGALVGGYFVMYRMVIKYENNPRFYLWEEDPETGVVRSVD
jgi:hypothetical protein